MECECGGWIIDENDGSYYEGNNLVERFIGSCDKCGKDYTWECVTPIVKTEIRNFKELE